MPESHIIDYKYKLKDKSIKVNSIKGLGLIIDSKLPFNLHIDYTLSSADRRPESVSHLTT